MGAGVGPGVLPGAVVGGEDDNRVGRFGADDVHDPADVVVKLQHRIRVVAKVRLAREHLVRAGGLVHLHEVDVHEERLAVFRVLLDVFDRGIRLPHIEVGEVFQRDHRAVVALDCRLVPPCLPIRTGSRRSDTVFQYSALPFGNHGCAYR